MSAINFAQAKELKHNSFIRVQAAKNLFGTCLTEAILSGVEDIHFTRNKWYMGLSELEKASFMAEVKKDGFTIESIEYTTFTYYYISLKNL